MIVSQSPQLLGMGVDEDTAAVISRDRRRRGPACRRPRLGDAHGRHAHGHATPTRPGSTGPILASGVILHVLPAGSEFDLTARVLLPSEPRGQPSREADELATANRDLRKMARDIAAGDIGPAVLRRRIVRRSRGAVQ